MKIKMKETPAELGGWKKRYIGYSSVPEKRGDWHPSNGGATMGTRSPKPTWLGVTDGDGLEAWLTARLTAGETLPDFFKVFTIGKGGSVLAAKIFEVV